MASSANPISVLCIIGSCISLQLGSALAVKLFDDGGTWGTSAVRLLVAAVVLLAITRPRVHEWNRQQWAGVLGLGLSLGLMNGFFYAGIDLVPLGPAVTIEFLGPLLLAAFLSRSLRDGICVVLAMTGMALLGLDAFNGNPLNPLGVTFLLGAALFWAIYILANKNAGALVPGQGGLAVAFVVGGVAMLPMGAGGAWNLVTSTDTLWFAIGTGILGSLVPYSLELIALRGLAPQCLFYSDFPRTRLRRILRVATARAKHQHAETSSHRRGYRSIRSTNRRNRGFWRGWRAPVEAEKATGRWQKSCATTSPVAASD
ncbi:hypothetical protein N579_00760 [Corynebacterium pseudodiphtheriticum 090104]|nr:hypothetical protein N579_00760 [Corynebacterium pseudodiphtheriticum 090104]